jgi:hypothetical protein
MKVGKSPSDTPIARTDGLTEAQLAKMRAIYEDPAAYAEWRLRMGLSQPPKPRTDPVMQHRLAMLFRGLLAHMEANAPPAPKQQAPPRKLTPEELAASWKNKPVTLSAELLAKYTRPEPSPDYEDIDF